MKKLILLSTILITLACSAQTGSYFYFQPYNWSRIHHSDSVLITAAVNTNQPIASVTWTQKSGPSVSINPALNWMTNIGGTSTFWLQGLAPGSYSFQATVTLKNSTSTFTTLDSLVVVADPVCPVCPTCPLPPAPRTVTSITLTLNGQDYVVPVAWIKQIGFNDGTSQ